MIAENDKHKFIKLSRTTGNKLALLGMDIEFIGGKKVALTTPHHADEAFEYFGKTLEVNVMNPTTSKLLTITDEAKELD